MGEVEDNEKKKRDRERREAKKAEEQASENAIVAADVAQQATLDRALIDAESVESELLVDGEPPQEAARLAADRRREYNVGFQINTRGVAAWAARKVLEARARLEAVKDIWRREVARAERVLEDRKGFFEEKLHEWAKTQPRDTKKGIRMPEAGLRLEFQDRHFGGVEVLDSAELCSAIVEKIGLLDARELGLVKITTQLEESAAKSWLSDPVNREVVPEGLGYSYSPPETVPDGKLKIVKT